MIQNDTLDSCEVNKMSTPALERLFIEMSNASTTLISNNYVGFEMPNGNSGNTTIGHTLDNSNGTSNGNNNRSNVILTNGSSNVNGTCSYGSSNHMNTLGYPSTNQMSTASSDCNIQHQINSTVSHHLQQNHNQHQHLHQHHHHHVQQQQHQHVTNPVFHNDSILTEPLTGTVHHQQRASRTPPDYNSSNTNGNHSRDSTNTKGVNSDAGGYQVPETLSSHSSLTQPIANNNNNNNTLSTPISSSAITLTTLSSPPSNINNITTSTSTPTMSLPSSVLIKNEPNPLLNGNGNHSHQRHSPIVNPHPNKNLQHPSASITISPPVSPIDMEEQEKVKLERKRQRNRIAASKCRKRKLEKIHLLEKRVNELKDENEQLNTKVNKLRDHVCSLKREVIHHVNSGCSISSPDNSM